MLTSILSVDLVDHCNGGISYFSYFEDIDSKNPIYINIMTHDISLKPSILIAPHIYNIFNVYDHIKYGPAKKNNIIKP